MKLLSYHIENYGKIHNADGDFSQDLTCVCEKNGHGKTTLASFIKAMFYGLPSYTTKTKAFDDRQHFYPFDGGKFGGNLTFEMQGKIYKIERFFDKKNNKGDELKVYCNGVPYFGFGEELGKEIFGLDEDSFKKTVFITAEEIEIASTHSIHEKLNRDLSAAGDDGDYETAVEALEKVKKELKAARGNNDLISAKKAQVAELTAQIGNLTDMSQGLQEEYIARERLQKELGSLESLQKTANERNLLLQQWETADRMQAQMTEKAQLWKSINEKYPLGIPNEEERMLLRECVQAQSALQGELRAASFNAEKETALQRMEEKFRLGLPTEGELDEVQRDIHRINALSAEEERLQNRTQTQKEKVLESKFSVRTPSEKDLEGMRAAAEEYKAKDAKLKELSATLLSSAPQSQAVKKGKTPFILFALAVALCIVGGVLLVAIPALGGGLLACGAAMLVGAIIQMKKSVNSTMPPSNAGIDLAALQAELRLSEEKIRAFTVPYGYYGNAGALYDLSALEEDFTAYNEYLAAETQRKAQIASIIEEKGRLVAKASGFFARFGEREQDLQKSLNALRAAVSSYESLRADKASAQRSGADLLARQKENETRVKALLEKYGFSPSVATMDGLKGLELDCQALAETEKDARALKKSLLEYKEQRGLRERPDGGEMDLDELHTRLSSVRRQLADCDKRIAETERFVEKLPDYQSALERAEEKLKEYKEKHALISDTLSALQEAERTLKERYIAPIKQRFSYYAEAIERVLDEKVRMDPDFHIVFERGGEERSERHLSAGERSICALCLRLALIDNMYENERPFIVMDDPFVHLDAEHLKRTLALVQELAKEKQIVYFCCHESRQIS